MLKSTMSKKHRHSEIYNSVIQLMQWGQLGPYQVAQLTQCDDLQVAHGLIEAMRARLLSYFTMRVASDL